MKDGLMSLQVLLFRLLPSHNSPLSICPFPQVLTVTLLQPDVSKAHFVHLRPLPVSVLLMSEQFFSSRLEPSHASPVSMTLFPHSGLTAMGWQSDVSKAHFVHLRPFPVSLSSMVAHVSPSRSVPSQSSPVSMMLFPQVGVAPAMQPEASILHSLQTRFPVVPGSDLTLLTSKPILENACLSPVYDAPKG